MMRLSIKRLWEYVRDVSVTAPQPVQLPNRAKAAQAEWVKPEIYTLVDRGCLVRWSDMADVSAHPRPQQVRTAGIQPHKLRLFWGGRRLNLIVQLNIVRNGRCLRRSTIIVARSPPSHNGSQVHFKSPLSTACLWQQSCGELWKYFGSLLSR